MKTYNCTLILTNLPEWKTHIQNIAKLKNTKSIEELLRAACDFGFAFDTILQ